MPFADFLAARNRLAREAEADRPLLGSLRPERDALHMPTAPEGPRLSDVPPTRPPDIAQQIVREYRKVRTVATGSLIDLII